MRGYPHRYIVLDTETTARQPGEDPMQSELTLRLGWALLDDYSDRERREPIYFPFMNAYELHEWIAMLSYSKEPIIIFAHNMGFDSRISGFFRELAKGTYSLYPNEDTHKGGLYKQPLVVIDNSPFIVRLFRNDGQVIILCDTVQWFGCSLEELGKSMGYLKMPKLSPDASDEEWFTYCRNDVDVLDRSLTRLWDWLQSIRCKDWQYTRAAQAMYLWRTRNGTVKIEPPEDLAVLSLDRHAYYGGRSDCFRVGHIEGPIWKVDVNSMYPFVMRNSLYPCRVLDYDHDTGCKTDLKLDFPLACTAEVWLDSESVPYPVRCSDGTHWVTGLVRTVLCGPELEMAYAWGHVVSVGRWTRYHLTNLFKRFVDEFYKYRLDAREKGDKAQDLLCKLILNSLYGKFGQKTGEWKDVGPDYPPGYFGMGKVIKDDPDKDIDFRVLSGNLQVRIKEQEDKWSFVPIAAYVASHGRVHMDGVRRELPSPGVYYQCVDSLLIDDANLTWLGDNLQLHPDRLGAFKFEGPYAWVDINNVNNLSLEGKIVQAGIKSSARPLGGDWWEVEEWETAPTGIFRGNVSSVSISRIAKCSSSRYGRGSISSDGSVRPFAVSNWDVSPEIQARRPLSRK